MRHYCQRASQPRPERGFLPSGRGAEERALALAAAPLRRPRPGRAPGLLLNYLGRGRASSMAANSRTVR